MKNALYPILFLLIVLIGPFSAQGQEEETITTTPTVDRIRRPNIIKINSLALVFQNGAIVYERGLKPRISVGVGLGYKYGGKDPKLFSAGVSSLSVEVDKIQGVSITPEARYYLKSCDYGKLEGFYAGVYFRYTGYGSGAKFSYNPANSQSESYAADIKLREYGIGLQLGYQIIIKERFSIDFLFIGPRYSTYTLGYEFTQQPSQDFLNELSGYINEVIDRFGIDHSVKVEQKDQAKASTSFSFANTRFGVSLGFAF